MPERFRIELSRAAKRALDQLREPDYGRVRVAIDALAEAPRRRGSEKVAGTPLFRLRVGNYRIVYDVDTKAREIVIVRVVRRTERSYRDL